MNAEHTPASHLASRAEAFAAEVRNNLADLPADELDDLLDGLDGDLAERLADGDEFGDAAQYADELRQAAGLPPRETMPAVAPKLTAGERMGEWINAKRSATATWFAATPARTGFRDFMLTLTPLWWVIRAMVVVWITLAAFGHPMVNGLQISPISFALNIFAIVVSVQWGRGKWLPQTWLKVAYNVARVAAVVLVLPVLVAVSSMISTQTTTYVDESPEFEPGLIANGEQINNIFAYDCEGNLLDGVRLYDQNGKPIDARHKDPWEPDLMESPEHWDEETNRNYAMGLHPLAEEAEAWNVFPNTISIFDDMTGEPGKAEPATPKRDELPPLTRDCSATDEAAAEVPADEPTEAAAGIEEAQGSTTP